MPDEEPDRLEREINEILNKIEQFPPPERRRARAAKRSLRRVGDAISTRQRAITRELARISLSQLVLLSFLLILGSFFFRGFPLAQWVMYAGIALLLASLALMVFGGRGRSAAAPSPRWRGRQLSYRQESLAARLRRWFQARKQR